MPCPDCGCAHVSARIAIDRPLSAGPPMEHRVCRNCGKRYRAECAAPTHADRPVVQVHAEAVIVFTPGATCPQCGRCPVPVTSAPKTPDGEIRIRYHRCECGWHGKSQQRK